MKEKFALTASEKNSPLWLRLVAHLEEKLAISRAKNDNDSPEYSTAKLRGRIAEIKDLLALGADKPEQ